MNPTKHFDGLFNDMRLQDARLGETVADRTDMIGRVMVKVSDIDFDLQDSQFDVLGTAYMISDWSVCFRCREERWRVFHTCRTE